jgi:hypothetical protein
MCLRQRNRGAEEVPRAETEKFPIGFSRLLLELFCSTLHEPLNREAVRDAMPAFFDLLREETEPAVRVVLGHFVLVFVYIRP